MRTRGALAPPGGARVALRASGRRDTWLTIQPKDSAGIMSMNQYRLVVTSDGRGYGCTWRRVLSDLCLVEGWA
jgi:hypothetical protein